MASVAPRIADRTGTAVASLPGSIAIRTPISTVGDPDTRAAVAVTADGRVRSRPSPGEAAERAALHAGIAATRGVRRRTERAPRTRAPASTAKPGCGSAILASPIGVDGESNTATG